MPIRVREETYDRLQARKRSGESFSDLLDRLADRDAASERGFGTMSDVDFEAAVATVDRRMDGEPSTTR